MASQVDREGLDFLQHVALQAAKTGAEVCRSVTLFRHGLTASGLNAESNLVHGAGGAGGSGQTSQYSLQGCDRPGHRH